LETIQIDPGNSGAYNNLGLIMENKGRIAEAVQYYHNALEIRPDSARAHNNLGNTLASIQKYDDAIKHYNEALKVKPNYAKAHFNLGSVLLVRGELDAAISHYLSALQIDPFYVEAHNNLGSALAKQGRFADAVRHFREAIRLKSDYIDARNNLENMLLRRNKIAEEIRRLENELAQNPKDSSTNYDLGNLYKDWGDLNAAFESYHKAVSLEPDFVEAINNMGIICALKGDYRKARLYFKESMLKKPDTPRAYYLMASTYARQNQIDKAVGWLRQSVDKGFDNWEFLKNDPNLENIRLTSYFKNLVSLTENTTEPIAD
jgi:tetratricopeptide (TPR) repeat protein